MTGTVPVNSKLLTGTVPVNKELLTGTVPVNNSILNLIVILKRRAKRVKDTKTAKHNGGEGLKAYN